MNLLSILKALGIKISPCSVVSNCQVEKQQIIDTARTQYMIETTAKQTQEQAMALANALGTKVMLNLMHWKDRTKLCLAY